MHSLEQRLCRLEKAVDPDDENAWMRHATDEELKDRMRELDELLQVAADACGMTVAELMAAHGFSETQIEQMMESGS